MRCSKPYVSRSGAFGCGQCLPCRLNRRRIWTHRLMLEGSLHEEKSFVTLTYEVAPVSGVVPGHLCKWLKRLRRRTDPRKLRYFGVGEYGDESGRPHYHVALFGVGSCVGGPVQGGVCRCLNCSVVRETWGYGHVMVLPLERQSAQYVCGYVTKKMTAKDDPRLKGRYPEFARMSLRPGIGADALWDAASEMMRVSWEDKLDDVPANLRVDGRLLPLGRYLRGKLRSYVGRDAKAPESALTDQEWKLWLVRQAAWNEQRSVASIFAELSNEHTLEARLQMKGKGVL